MAYTTINKSSLHQNTILYTGDGGASQAQTGVGFSADLTWIKSRDSTEEHVWTDTVRGATYWIRSNATNASAALATGLLSWQSDGFTVGNNGVVGTANDYVAWNWKANGSGSSNTDGSITSTVSANTTSGFSIVKWVGTGANATIGHGLGAVPKMIIVKNLSSTTDWYVYTEMTGNTHSMKLNSTDGKVGAYSDNWNDTTPTSSVFSVGSSSSTGGASGNNMIAYCFAEKIGYSKMGSYTGGGSNFPFIYTGFKPSWLMIKRTNSAENWHIFDIKRNPYYPTSSSYGGMATRLMANLNNADDLSQGGFEFLSNGLKMTTSWAGGNGSGDNFIYMCFGQSIVGTNNVPATAR